MQTEHNDHLSKAHPPVERAGHPVRGVGRREDPREAPDLRHAPLRPASADERRGVRGAERRRALRRACSGRPRATSPTRRLSTHNLQRAAEAKGSEFRFGREVVEIQAEDGRIRGVKLDDGTEVASPVVVNVAGPHSAVVNGMAGALDDMTIETKPLRQEVVHVPAPEGFDFESLGTVVSDSDIGCYIRPETGNHILIGSEDPECDPREFVDPDDYVRDFTEQGHHPGAPLRAAGADAGHPVEPARGWSTSTTPPTTGSPSTTRAACRASTWRSAPPATSSRTRR